MNDDTGMMLFGGLFLTVSGCAGLYMTYNKSAFNLMRSLQPKVLQMPSGYDKFLGAIVGVLILLAGLILLIQFAIS